MRVNPSSPTKPFPYVLLTRLGLTHTQASDWATANPVAATGAVLVLGGGAVIAAPALVTGPALQAAGFGTIGVAKGEHID